MENKLKTVRTLFTKAFFSRENLEEREDLVNTLKLISWYSSYNNEENLVLQAGVSEYLEKGNIDKLHFLSEILQDSDVSIYEILFWATNKMKTK